MMQQAVVAVVVLVAAAAVVRRYAPSVWQALRVGLAARGARLIGLKALASRLEAQRPEMPACASSCATCSGCDLGGKTPAGEYVIVLERLKKR